MLLREAKIGAPDLESRTAPVTISTEYPVDRGGFVEILSHAPADVDLTRAPLPLLTSHNADELNIGIVENLRLVGRTLKGIARFGSSPRALEVFRDVVDRVVTGISVGYELIGRPVPDGSADRLRFRWRPLEVSAVAVPADPRAGFYRSKQEKTMHEEYEDDAIGVTEEQSRRPSRSERKRIAQEEAESASREIRERRKLTKRNQDILALGTSFRSYGGDELAQRAILDPDMSYDAFRGQLLEQVESRVSRPQLVPAWPAHYGQAARVQPYAGKLRAFENNAEGHRAAHASGMWLSAVVGKNPQAAEWCRDHGIGQTRSMSEGIFGLGGAVVPQELSNAILMTAEQYSIFRRYARVMPMNSASLAIPKPVGGLTPYFVPENNEITTSDQQWSNVQLNAKKLAVMVRLSTELVQDSVISLADYLATEAARAFGEREDTCGFAGTGISTHGGMEGIVTKLERAAYAGGRATTTSAHDTFAEIDTVDMAIMLGKLPARALPNAKVYCSPSFFGNVIERLTLSAGGLTAQDLASKPAMSFRGYEVVVVPGSILASDPTADYTNKVMCLFGDLNMAAAMGTRRDVQVQLLTETYAAYDQLGVLVTERFDIVNHDLGDTTTAGAMVGLFGNT